HRWAPGGSVTTIVPKRRGIGGLALHADGGVVISGRTLQHVKGGETRELLALDGVSGFNDLTTAADGCVYAGALRLKPFEGEQPVPGEIWKVGADGEPAIVFGGVDWPNGIGLSPDGHTLYACDYASGRVLAHDLDSPDEAARVFAVSPSGFADGL